MSLSADTVIKTIDVVAQTERKLEEEHKKKNTPMATMIYPGD
jgi:hypothetical protein